MPLDEHARPASKSPGELTMEVLDQKKRKVKALKERIRTAQERLEQASSDLQKIAAAHGEDIMVVVKDHACEAMWETSLEFSGMPGQFLQQTIVFLLSQELCVLKRSLDEAIEAGGGRP